MFFHSFSRIFEVALISILIYTAFVVFLRFSGKRTLANYTIYDWVISITIGSVAASTIVFEEIVFLEGLVSILLLIGLQKIFAHISVKSVKWRAYIEGRPTLLYYKGNFLKESMLKTGVTKTDISQSTRLKANTTPDKVHAVILEKNGAIAVLESLSKEGERDLFLDLGIEYPQGKNINEKNFK
jgi:uncharacterized membrane protein YcaP (DUF421 family)